MATQSYRRMEKFMIEDCQQSMKGTTSNELKVLYTILLNCRDNFEYEEAITFVKFVKLTYELGEVEISLEETFKLYNRFIESLYQKVKQKRFNPLDGTLQSPKQFNSIVIP
jgi:coenzyme F420-reducing hydrogenase beta subunit